MPGFHRQPSTGLLSRRALVASAALAAVIAAAGPSPAAAPDRPAGYPWQKRIAAAERFAAGRQGTISFAVVDESGELRGDHVNRVHNSASVVKVMFMVALLRQPDVRHDALTGAERHLIGPMIKRSDNQAANAIYSRVGQAALTSSPRRPT